IGNIQVVKIVRRTENTDRKTDFILLDRIPDPIVPADGSTGIIYTGTIAMEFDFKNTFFEVIFILCIIDKDLLIRWIQHMKTCADNLSSIYHSIHIARFSFIVGISRKIQVCPCEQPPYG